MLEKPHGEPPERKLLSPEDTDRARTRLEKRVEETVKSVDELPAIGKEIVKKLNELQNTIRKHKELGAYLTFNDLDSVVMREIQPAEELRGVIKSIDYVIGHLVDSIERSK